MFGFHAPELIIVLVVALLIFGPKRLPEMGAGVGKFIREFRKGVNEISNPTTPKEESSTTIKSPDLEAIERANASAKARASIEEAIADKTTGSEVSATESKID